jgi:3-methyladenine DNA glycosylase Mpg
MHIYVIFFWCIHGRTYAIEVITEHHFIATATYIRGKSGFIPCHLLLNLYKM